MPAACTVLGATLGQLAPGGCPALFASYYRYPGTVLEYNTHSSRDAFFKLVYNVAMIVHRCQQAHAHATTHMVRASQRTSAPLSGWHCLVCMHNERITLGSPCYSIR